MAVAVPLAKYFSFEWVQAAKVIVLYAEQGQTLETKAARRHGTVCETVVGNG
jgi:hypothetical protein